MVFKFFTRESDPVLALKVRASGPPVLGSGLLARPAGRGLSEDDLFEEHRLQDNVRGLGIVLLIDHVH